MSLPIEEQTLAEIIESALEKPAPLSMQNEPGKRKVSKTRKAQMDKPSQALLLFRAYSQRSKDEQSR